MKSTPDFFRPGWARLAVLAGFIGAFGISRTLAEIILYDQTSTPGGLLGSQNFLDYDPDDSTGADDFVVPTGETWPVSGVRVLGYGPSQSFNVTFFSDDATFPGSVVCQYSNLGYSIDGSFFVIDLPDPCLLSAGTYWLAVQSNDTYFNNWVWVESVNQINSGAVWENPLDGYGTGMTTFQRLGGANYPDLSFQIMGSTCADLAISQNATQKTVKGALYVTYAINVQSFGVGTATSVTVTDFLPPETTFASASSSQGTIAAPPVGFNGTVICDLGSISTGSSATVTITAKVKTHGNKSILNKIKVESDCDPNADNNQSTLSTILSGPNK